jgi:fatty acid elongase 3
MIPLCSGRKTPHTAMSQQAKPKLNALSFDITTSLMTPFSDLLLSIAPTDSIPAHLKSYVPGTSPFSTWPVVSTVIASYLVSIFTTREFMKDRPSFHLQTLFRYHNALLSTGSLVLLLLIAEEVVSVWMQVGTYYSMCAPSSWTDVSDQR